MPKSVPMTPEIEELIEEALAYQAESFEDDEEVDGSDMVQWFAEWRIRMQEAFETDSKPKIEPKP